MNFLFESTIYFERCYISIKTTGTISTAIPTARISIEIPTAKIATAKVNLSRKKVAILSKINKKTRILYFGALALLEMGKSAFFPIVVKTSFTVINKNRNFQN